MINVTVIGSGTMGNGIAHSFAQHDFNVILNDINFKQLEQAEERIRKLEYYNAELSRWANDICLPKLSELSDELAMRYNQKKHRNRNWKNELPRV